MDKKLVLVAVFLALGILLAWSPWLTEERAKQLAYDGFVAEWRGVADGCGFNCDGCGVKEANKAFFGYDVRIEYDCGLKMSGSPEKHPTSIVFVSLLGTVHGLP